jgi:sRNA-binding protein
MPPTQTSRDGHRAEIRPVLALLAKRWPRCFTLNSRRRKPLAVGIRAEIEQRLPEVDPRLLRKALRSYVVNMAYQRASMVAGTVRVTLDGSARGTVTTEEARKAILTVAALAEKQRSRLAALARTGTEKETAIPISKSPEPGAAGSDRLRVGLADLREAGRRRATNVSSAGSTKLNVP